MTVFGPDSPGPDETELSPEPLCACNGQPQTKPMLCSTCLKNTGKKRWKKRRRSRTRKLVLVF